MIDRYQNDEMKEIWSNKSKYNSWLLVEIYATQAFGELGVVPQKDVELITKNASYDEKRIDELELELKHDVVAFTRSVSESLGDEKKWIHYGLTSTDVVDTAQGYRLKQCNDLIERQLKILIKSLKDRAIENKYIIMMGRTHGVHAELTTFGYKLALYYDEMNRNLKRFKQVREEIEIGKISGAVGTYANVEPFVQDYVCEKLGINSSLISTQTLQRDRHANYISTIALIASSLDKMAVEFRHLQRTELREVEEGFMKKQKGSSAMPHKKNPIGSENISGLSRVVRGYMIPAYEDVALWHERDISHSSVERIILEDSTSLIHYMLKRFTGIIDNLYINEERMLKNINSTNNVFYSQRVLLSLIDAGLSREEAYDLVQPIAIDSFNNEHDFKVNMRMDATKYLDEETYNECFKNDYHLKNIDYIFKRLGIDE